jgi:hypothetical protein
MQLIDQLANTNEGRFVAEIFGLPKPSHCYLRCRQCGSEYYGHRPLYCTCGYAGGAIECFPLRKINKIMRKIYGDEYEVIIADYKKLIASDNPEEALKNELHARRYDSRKNPRLVALFLSAYYDTYRKDLDNKKRPYKTNIELDEKNG